MKVTKKNEVLYTEISKFPAVSRDLALLVDNSVEFAQIEQIARQTEKKLLKKVELFDVYEGDKLPAGKKSYAVNFILQDEEKTMGDKQIDAIMQKLIANIKKNSSTLSFAKSKKVKKSNSKINLWEEHLNIVRLRS